MTQKTKRSSKEPLDARTGGGAFGMISKIMALQASKNRQLNQKPTLSEYRKASAKKLRKLSTQLHYLAKRIDEIGAVSSIPKQSDQLFQAAGELQHELTEILRYAGALRWRVKEEGWR